MLGNRSISILTKKCSHLPFIQQRNMIRPRQVRHIVDVIGTVMDNTKVHSLNDWKIVRNTILEHEFNRGQYTNNNIDSKILGYCALKKDCDRGTSYLNFLKSEDIKPNLATIGKYLKLLYAINADIVFIQGKTLPKIEEELILRYYEDLRRDYPILDSYSLENAVLALSVTSQWKTCLDLLQDIKVTATPNAVSYSSIVAAAFSNKEEDLAWQILEEMFQSEKVPESIAFHAYLSTLKKMRKKSLIIEKLEKLFLFFQNYDLKCTEDVALSIADSAEKLELMKNFTKVSYKGLCYNCSSKLKNFELTTEEFAELKLGVFENVIVGKDIFSRTNPAELEKFNKFVANMGAFDVVLDGLNVAYSAGTKHSPFVLSGLILGYCALKKDCDRGTSYLNFLKSEDIKPNLATIGKYLKLLYAINADIVFIQGKTLPKIEEELILRYYEDLRRDYPILDSYSLENAVLALSVTSQWKTCLDLLQDIKVTATPNAVSYSSIVAAAFSNKEEDLAWQILEEMFQSEKVPESIAFHAYLSTLKKMRKKSLIIEKLEKLFLFFQNYDLKCTEDVALSIADSAEKLELMKNFTKVSYKGLCYNCSSKLKNFELTTEEFAELKLGVFENVIVGKDIFSRTNPAELEKFNKFVANMGAFDVVLDGLNVAYSAGTKHSPFVLSGLVAAVVQYFVERNRSVLVLGRMHMNKWPKKNWGYVNDNATVFLTQDISQDDPYLLYCALHSGKNTVIITRDLMRSHKFRLKSPHLKMRFNRWLNQKQWQLIRVDDKKGPAFRIPPAFTITAQKVDGMWHIPYEKTADRGKDKDEFHETWLCFKC
ncbi:unnamed protein product [Acanthoscelides obtectus]|uniref:Mitochondrial ribonuclease P catalytic subunit n=1 Tax=Acanthoscelides obtectus TaxID=200917 RepID=A0A9P0KD58_ACAOB|nr:unnamed protein product [Acanthoscelides obtectus]CAK1664238.1 Mitochondrial ribonuclease P catalytic subunit [Acanthoscelides obtectus]